MSSVLSYVQSYYCVCALQFFCCVLCYRVVGMNLKLHYIRYWIPYTVTSLVYCDFYYIQIHDILLAKAVCKCFVYRKCVMTYHICCILALSPYFPCHSLDGTKVTRLWPKQCCVCTKKHEQWYFKRRTVGGDIMVRMVNSWVRLIAGKPEKLSCLMYHCLMHMDNGGLYASSWLQEQRSVLNSCVFSGMWLSQEVRNPLWLGRAVEERHKDHNITLWYRNTVTKSCYNCAMPKHVLWKRRVYLI